VNGVRRFYLDRHVRPALGGDDRIGVGDLQPDPMPRFEDVADRPDLDRVPLGQTPLYSHNNHVVDEFRAGLFLPLA
jgi:hypothetical protein